MKPLTTAVVQSGLVPPSVLEEMNRWGLMEFVQPPKALRSIDEVIDRLREVLESEGFVDVKSTDLDALKEYLEGQSEGKLHLVDDETGEKTSFRISYAKTKMGEYIIPWRSETIEDLMANGQTYLAPKSSKEKIYFADVRELFFGETKAFMVCTPVG